MKTTVLPREFVFKHNGKETILEDPNIHFTPEEVLDIYSLQHPELTTASITGPEIKADRKQYIFSTVLGTKG